MMDANLSRVQIVDREKDFQIVYQNDQYVCLRKLFPLCECEKDMPLDDYKRFHLRFYIPREYLIDARRKAKQAIVMTNGLDEISSFSLYDELGCRLASRGLVTILHPLPDHLNRHTRFRKVNPNLKQILDKPSQILLSEPSRLYQRYLQFRQELKVLIAHLKGKQCTHEEANCTFYENLFDPDVRVSSLGYSLGAAAMLCCFLEQEKDLNSCFLLSGAINLRHIISEKLVPQPEWDSFIKGVQDYFFKHTGKTLADRLFGEVFLGALVDKSSELLREHGRRVLFLYGGKDQIINYQALETIMPQGWGLGMVVLPGINHFLAIDEEWKQWIPLVVNLIVDYEQNALRQTITRGAVLREYRSVAASGKAKTPGGKRPGTDLTLVRGPLIGLDPRRIDEQERERKVVRQRLRTCSFNELKIGERLYSADLVAFNQLWEALLLQKEDPHWKKEKLGDILVEALGVVRRDHVEAVAAAR